MTKRLTANRDIATAVGLAGDVTKLARSIGQAPTTIRRQVQRGFLSFEVAVQVAQEFDLDIQALQTKPIDAGTAQS